MSMNAPQIAWPPLTPAVKLLLIVLGAAFLAHPILSTSLGFSEHVEDLLYLSNKNLLGHLYLWQPLTYQLFHDGFIHLFFNLFVLYFVGGDMERRWGRLALLRNMLLSGLGAAVVIVLASLVAGLFNGAGHLDPTRTVGASGAISGLLAAFALYHWEQRIQLFFAVTVKGKWTLAIFLGMDALSLLFGQPISVAGHVGGMLTGFLLTVLLYDPTRWIARFKLWRTRRRFKAITEPPPKKPTLH